MDLPSPQNPAQADAVARTMINDVWATVDQNYLDARSSGFSRANTSSSGA